MASCLPREAEVFECLCKEYGSTASISEIAKRTDLFPLGLNDAEMWFRQMKDSFLITEDNQGKVSQVHAFSARTRLCLDYSNNGKCDKQDCTFLHVCRDYITDSCNSGATCPLNHQFHNQRDKALLSRSKLDQFTDLQLKRLVLSSTPQICVEYNNGVCKRGDCCTRIHMCCGYLRTLRKCCSGEYECGLDHETAMDTDQTRAVMNRLMLNNIGKNDLITMVLDDKLSVSGSDNTKCHIHQDKPEACICSQFLTGKCYRGFRCENHHCLLPYHWQYKVTIFDEWKSFSEKDNLTLEKLYCDVNVEEQVNFKPTQALDVSRLERKGIIASDQQYEVKIDLDNMKIMTFQKPKGGGVVLVGELRRLSTLSYVHATSPSDLVFTNWKWYWKDDSNVWHLYDKDYLKRDLQKLIEQAFLGSCDKSKPRASFTFTTADNVYNLVFCSTRVMYAVNLKTEAKRQVKRRPEKPISNEELDDIKRILECSVERKTVESTPTSCIPSHWSPLLPNAQYTRVRLDKSSTEFKDVEQLFKKSINGQVVIKSIERVQNPFLWAEYCRKKETTMAAATLNKRLVYENKFFYKPSPGSVAAICENNFHPRSCGKKVMFDKTTLYTENVDYSHHYATRDVDPDTASDSSQFMFLAKVLVGSHTEGHSSYQRPPPNQPSNPASNLNGNDSCVDDKSKTTVFVAFNKNHFYPEYIIKYSSVCYTTSALTLGPPLTSPSYRWPYHLRFFDKSELSTTIMVGMASTAAANNLTSPITSATVQLLAKESSLQENDSQRNTASQGTATYHTRSSTQNEIGSNSQSETRNQKTQQSKNKAKLPQQETKHQEPTITNLANNSTASAPCKKSLEYVSIQTKGGENCSSSDWSSDLVSSSEENKPASDGCKTWKLLEKESTYAHPDEKSQLKQQLTAQTPPSSLSAAKSSCSEPKSNPKSTKPKNEPQKKKCPEEVCQTKIDHLATKVSNTNEQETPASAILSALPSTDVRNDSVKQGVMYGEEKQPTGLKESDSLAASQDPVKVECQRKLSASNAHSTPPDPQTCTPSKPAALHRTLKEYYETLAYISQIRQNLFPGGCGDTAEWSKESRESCNEFKSNLEDTKPKNEPQKKKSPEESYQAINDQLATKASSTNGQKIPVSALLDALLTARRDARNDSVKKGVNENDEKQRTGGKESDRLATPQDPVNVKCQRKLPVSNSSSTPPDSQKCTSSKLAVLDRTLKGHNGTVSSAHISKPRHNLFPGGCGDTSEWSKASNKSSKELKSNLEDTKPENEPQKKKSTVESCATENDHSASKVSSISEKKPSATGILSELRIPIIDPRNDSVKKAVMDSNEKQHSGLKESDRFDSLAASQDPVKMESQRKVTASNSSSTPPDSQKCTPSKPAVFDCISKEYYVTVFLSKASEKRCKEPKSNLEDTKPTNEPQKKKSPVDSCETKHDHLATNVSSTNEKETPASAILSALPTNDVRKDSVKKGVMMDSDEKKSTDLKESDSLATSQDPVKVECRTLADPQKCTPSKKAVFDCILKEFNGTVSFDTISNRQDLFPSGCGDIAEWFNASKESFLLSESKDGNVLEVSAFCPRAQLCSTQACKKEDCQYLHVCRDNIAGFCRFGDRCQRNHSFQYDEDRKFLSKLIMLNGLTEENLRKVIQLSLPQVCFDYNEGSCTKGQSCSKIHICKDMIRKKCKNKEDCALDHESAMTTSHTRTVLERYHMEHLKSNVVKRMILVYDDSKKGHVHEDKPDAPICSEFVLGKCKKGVKCSGHHCSLPYHWQYKVPKVEEWKSFSETDNETLEKLYCDVMLEKCSASGFQISLESEEFLLLDVNFLLDDKVMIIQNGVITDIRRLSTESYANNPSNPVATAWTWYWKDEDGMWLQYGVDHLVS